MSQAISETSQGNRRDGSDSAQKSNGSVPCDAVTFSEPIFWENDVIEAEERAAILQYDGGLSREEAERAAGLEKKN